MEEQTDMQVEIVMYMTNAAQKMIYNLDKFRDGSLWVFSITL